jgi:glycine hydroxymethyltransferase
MSYLNKYLKNSKITNKDEAAIAFLASIDYLEKTHNTEVSKSIVNELINQRTHLKLIASENYSSLAVQLAMGNLLTDKYAEGFCGHRFYAGCEHVDVVENEANIWAKKIFNADHAYVQPHSGADANLVAFWSILVQKVQNKYLQEKFLNENKTLDQLSSEEYEKVRKILNEQKIMGLSLNSGGHLTHGYRQNISSKMFRAVSYDVDPKTGMIDYLDLQKRVKEEKPLILIAGYSAYPRLLDFAKFKEIADSVNATLMVDMAHFAGLVAGGVMQGNYDPVPFADIVTSTTHKTLRGPRGGLILCKNEFKDTVNKGCPIVLGGPLPHVMAAKAVALKEASTKSYSDYAHQIVRNAKEMAKTFMENNVKILTDGTDNHLILLDVQESFNLTGRQAENLLVKANITANRNCIPNDMNGAWFTSGVRLGTPALTSLGMKETQMREIALIIVDLLKNAKPSNNKKTNKPSKSFAKVDKEILLKSQSRVKDLLNEFVLYPELIID